MYTGTKVGRQATTTPVLKTVTTIYLQASPDQPHATPLAIARYNTLIDPTTVIYYNCNKDGHFTLSCPEPKNTGDIKEIEEGKTTDKSEKEEP